jgi:uncharacterized membrane protein
VDRKERKKMRIPENLGFILLGIWLILEGFFSLVSGSAIGVLLGLLALAAGILILLRFVRKL